MKYDVTLSVWGKTFRVKNVEALNAEAAEAKARRALAKNIRTNAVPHAPKHTPRAGGFEEYFNKIIFGQ
jgi:hypothetical protein